MDPELVKAKARQYSAEYYYRHQEAVRRKRIVALMQKGHMPKLSTLQRYQLQATT